MQRPTLQGGDCFDNFNLFFLWEIEYREKEEEKKKNNNNLQVVCLCSSPH